MSDSNNNGLTLEWTPAGKQTATVTARLNGDVLEVETLNITKSKAREGFAKKLCDGRPGIDREAVEAELLKLADRGNGEPADVRALDEVDASRIVRPERFITPEVSGLTVPTVTTFGDRVSGRWAVYVRWSDGKRERRALGPALELPGGWAAVRSP